MEEKTYTGKYQSPLGNLLCAGRGDKLILLQYERPKPKIAMNPDWTEDNARFRDLFRQLDEYFAGKRGRFDVELELNGTPFQRTVWERLTHIPPGETRSYKELAAESGSPLAFRAVGNANNKNPVAIVCPCHRVIGANGKLVGYASGLDKKIFLLELERVLPAAANPA